MLVGVIQLRQIALDSMDPFELQLTMFENRKKSLIQHCERSEPMFTFWVAKSLLKMPKMVDFGELLKTWSVTRQVSW